MFSEYKNMLEAELKKYFSEYSANSSYSSKIWESMEYTPLLGGKRLRAIMCIEIARLFGIKTQEILPLACSIEIMHAYSLIHDDLPCMDNDDLRRGKPTNHKVFGEAIATLAGDSLISFGAEIIIDKLKTDDKTKIELIKDYLKCAGARGIVAGQTADIEAEGKKIDIENLKYIHKFKTGALFEFSILSAAKFAHAPSETLLKLKEYASNFGVMFQVYDDIIDCTLTSDELGKTAGKDERSLKSTYVSVYGLSEAKNIFYSLIDKNRAILSSIGIKSDIFEEIYNNLIEKVMK